MNTPAICLTKHDLGDARKAFDAKVAEVKRIDESNAKDSHITAARIMLDAAIAERGAIVASINDQAKSGQFNVDWGNLSKAVSEDQAINGLDKKVNTTKLGESEIDNGNQYGQNNISDEGTPALGGVVAGENTSTERVGRAKRGNAGGSSTGTKNDSGLDGAGVSGKRSRRSGTSTIYSPEAGAAGRGLGDSGVSGNGEKLSGNDGGANGQRVVSAPNIPAHNFSITDNLRLGKGGEVEKFNDNLLAIRTLKQIESESRRATTQEQEILARYVGWGGLANAFPNPQTGEFKDAWKERGTALTNLLTSKEYQLARRSTLDSHYTSQTVVSAMWDAVKHLGFSGGMVLESSMGSGNFLGLMPGDLKAKGNTKFLGVEYDNLTARIATLLYPQETVLNSGFQDVALPDNTFDLSIGNPPFGSQSLRFKYKPEINGFSIHNQFFLSSIDAIKPGGLQVQVVSRFLLDSQDRGARTALAKKAKLIGAIRLPDTAFKENARTEVVTDIIFLQRLSPQEEAKMEDAFDAANSKPSKDRSEEAERQARMSIIPDWINTKAVPDPLGGEAMPANAYFASNPHMILGTLERSGSMAHGKDITVRMDKDANLSDLLSNAIKNLPRDLIAHRAVDFNAMMERYRGMTDSLKIALAGHEQGSITIDNDGGLKQVIERETGDGEYELAKRELTPASPWSSELYQNAQGKWYKIEAVLDENGKSKKVVKDGVTTNSNIYERVIYENESDIPAGLLLGESKFTRLKSLIEIRDLLVAQLGLEAEDSPSKMIEDNRTLLNSAYKSFVAKHGYISERSNASLVSDMPDGALVQALEFSYRPEITKAKAAKTKDEARPAHADPAPILSERVILKYAPPTHAASHADALSIVTAESGRVDMERIAGLLGKSVEDAQNEMLNEDKPLIFVDPEMSEIVSRNEYLSGQVVRKLVAAQEANLQKNIEALKEVQPEPWGADGVTVFLGSVWVPPSVYADFIAHISGSKPKVTFSQVTNSYSISEFPRNSTNESEFGSEGISSSEIISDLLNSRATKITYRDSDGKTHVDQEKTALALLAAKKIKNEFNDWIFADGDRRNSLVGIFNEKFNTRVNRQHDGSHLILPGKVPDIIIQMRRHQKNAIWRGISERFMLLDHAVGAGKTYTAIARAMERRRMGLSKKPAIIVPNHMVAQFTSDVYRLYPGAKVLAAGKADFEKSRRRKLFAKIATGDFDIVIIPHSSFGFIGISPETESRYLESELRLAEDAIEEAQEQAEEEGHTGYRKPFGVKEAERLRDTITARMDKLKGANNKDKLLTFEQLGIDDMTVDEAHEFKNLFYSSRLTGVKGMGNKTGSQKAFDLYNKVRVLRESPKGTVTFMTGTPISNSAVEMFTMMRYLAADQLQDLGLEHFDAWRAQFVSTDAGWEPNETGRLKEINRLGRTWANMRSLMDLYYSFTDSVSNDDIKKAYSEDNNGEQFPIPNVKGGDRESVVIQPTKAQVKLLGEIIEGFDSLPDIKDPRERNIRRLKLMDRARKVSLDVRAVDPSNPSNEEGGKLETIANRTYEIYKKWDDDKGTQIIFLDRSVPKAKGDDKVIKEYDALISEQNKALENHDEDALRRVGEKLEKYDSNEIEELRNAQNGGWNAYQQIKDNLVKLGIPANEVRFVQEANNDAQKQVLFDAFKSGEVRVLIGSTPRMGAGTNVQDRLVALHHADVTWKPSDIEQREGRIIRQQNKLLKKYGIDNFEVEILAYATERTIDAKMWNLNSSKLKTINGIRNYDGAFSMDFEDDASVSMAELAALASGDPLLLERVKLMSEIDSLELLKRQHARKEWNIVGQIEDAEKDIARIPKIIETNKKTAEFLQSQFDVLADRVAERNIEIEGKTYHTEVAAKQAAFDIQKRQQGGDENAKFSISINGRRKSSQTGYMEEIFSVFGDQKDFDMTIGNKSYPSRLDAGREIARIGTELAQTFGKNDSKTEIIGKFLGLDVEVTFEHTLNTFRQSKSGEYGATIALLSDDGTTFASIDVSTDESPKFTSTRIKSALENLDKFVSLDILKNQIENGEYRLDAARRNLPALKAKRGGEFPQQAELQEKNKRLEEVVRILADDSRSVAIEAEKEKRKSINPLQKADGSFVRQEPAKFSLSGAQAQANTIGNSQGTAITQVEADKVVGRVVAGLKNGIQGISIRVVDSFNNLPQVIIDQAIREKTENAIDGVNADNVIYLVRDKHATPEHLEKTLLHELVGHAGLAKLFGAEITQKMNGLYKAIGGNTGLTEIAVRHNIDLSKYALGLAENATLNDDQRIQIMMEELLANIAQNKPTLKAKLKGLVGMIRSWLRKAGFTGLSQGTDADIYYLLSRAKSALNANVSSNAGIRFSRTEKQADTPAFKKWFGDSKVVDADGNPLVVYHGTNAAFSAFDKFKLGKYTGHPSATTGFFFTKSQNVAAHFSGTSLDENTWPRKTIYNDGANIMPVFLSITNPIEITAKEFVSRFVRGGESATKYRYDAIAAGFDGAIIKKDESLGDSFGGEEYAEDAYVAFNPTQIKSAIGNNGNFDANSADIRYKLPSAYQYFEPTEDISTEEYQQYVDNIVENWSNKPRIRVVDYAAQLPFEADKNAMGIYRDGSVYLIAANIRSKEQMQFVLMHEVLGHAGLRGLFGSKLNGKLIALAANNKPLSKASAQWRSINRSQSVGITESEFFALSIEEVLADMAGLGVKMSGFDAFIAALQKALRAINLGAVANWLEGRTQAEVISMLSKAKQHIEQGSTDRTMRAAFAPAYSIDPNKIAAEDALAEIASMNEAFRFKASEGETMESIVADVDPAIKVRKITSIPGETRYELILPDETMARIMVRPFNKYGNSIYGFDMDENNEMTNQVTERPGKNAEEAYGKDDMWIDVSLLNEGSGFGAKIYHIAANYAHNTGKVFIGDPAGVTHAALLRRPEQMLSSALKFGTTEHLAPHPAQIRGNAKNGIAPLDWVYGDDVGNIQKLIDLTIKNIDNVGGIGGIEYDGQSGEFIDSTGSRITREDLRGLAEIGLARAAQAGGSTLARYAFTSASLQSLRAESARPGADRLLVRLREQLRDHVSAVDKNGSLDSNGKREAKRLFYSTGSPGSLTTSLINSVNNVKNVKLPANYLVGDLFDRSGQIGWWDKTVGTPYNLAKRNPLFANVYNRIQSFIGDVSMFTAEAADLAPTILPKLEKLADLKKMPLTAEDTKAISAAIFEGTLAWARDENGRAVKVKDSEDAKAGVKWEDHELRDIFNLNDKQIGLYKEFRAAIDKSLTNLAITDMVKAIGKDYRHLMTPALEKGNVTAASEFLSEYFTDLAATDEENSAAHFDTVSMLMNKAEKANDLMDRGYAPLSRFGKHTVYVEEAGEQVYFGLYESKMEAAKAARNMRADYPNATVTAGTMSEEAYKLFAGVSIETVELFGDMLGLSDPDTSDATREAYQAYLKMAKNNRSSMKRLINRKGITGFSEDAGRVLANFVYSNGRMTSANVHMGELDEAVNAIPKIQGELKDAAVQLSEHVKNPENAGTKLGGLMFAQYLGGSVASAMVNLTQPLMMTMPYLSQYGGIKSASSELVAAARDAYKETTGDKALDAALKLAEEEGIVSPQEVHHIQAQAAGNGTLQAGDGTLLGDSKAKVNNGMQKIMLGWGKLFALAEQSNRRITFIAAYRTAIAQNIPNPAKFAEEAIAATQGVYNSGNKPRWARNTLGSLAMTFKQYSIAYVELLSRMWNAGEPGSPERSAGRRGALYMLAVLFIMSGADGLPFEQDLEDLIDGILQRMGYNFSTKRKKEQFFVDVLGQEGADFALKGVSGITGVPIDLAGRLGMGNLIPATGLFKTKDSHVRDVAELAGAPGDFAVRSYNALSNAASGNVKGAINEIAPRAVSNAMKGAEMVSSGQASDTRGYKINDVSPLEGAMKAIGFQPNSTAHIQDDKGQALDLMAQARAKSAKIQEHWAQGLAKGDADMVQEAREMRDEWNAKNPESPIRTNMPAIIKRVRNMKMDAMQRTQNTAPKAMKAAVREELAS